MRKGVILLFIVSLIILNISACKKGPSPEEIFSEAKSLQEETKYAEAVTKYEELVTLHPRSELAPQSQFMIGFICANEIGNLEKASVAYKAFLENYSDVSDSGMVASAKWELDNLGKDINEIDDLSVVTEGEEEGQEEE
ncbi:hypothetical protein CEE37_08440 [candidate division LCP-89 bacterium B3_LCP]|uniref:Outer membrane lipoprotein BamD-like domain-containing protein n=1 Tax=candidate division LCP-89 bacterium B3_LCP TaxID=2012998 RepID=A0A532UZF9_UNCL8|nr:MAG: hypothetical protein CEE37_08440 [candidate division LCP-89 bacterium B3_LCP]